MPRALLVFLFISACNFSHAAQTILVFGDSLSAGFGINQAQSWPTLLARRLADEHYPYQVANASISGETSSGGAARLGPALKQFEPAIVIIALGANDGLRGLPLREMRSNLDAMIRQAGSAKVLLIGMRLPPNYGVKYSEDFAKVYAGLAKSHRIAFLPFLFAGFADKRDAFQDDGLHPTAATQTLMLDNVWRALLPLLRKS